MVSRSVGCCNFPPPTVPDGFGISSEGEAAKGPSDPPRSKELPTRSCPGRSPPPRENQKSRDCRRDVPLNP